MPWLQHLDLLNFCAPISVTSFFGEADGAENIDPAEAKAMVFARLPQLLHGACEQVLYYKRSLIWTNLVADGRDAQ